MTLDFKAILHVAPEKPIAKWLRQCAGDYLSVDLSSEAMVKMDVTDLKLGDESQTLVWISHVLEHVEDDRKAIAEIHRVLTPGGVAVVQVPIWRQQTFEDFSLSTPEQRSEAFFQANHVRLYGMDIADRFESVGFSTEIVRAQDFGPRAVLEQGLSFPSTNEVFVFRKSVAGR